MQQNYRWRLAKPIYYMGTQWAVTRYGLENFKGPYHYSVEARDLFGDGLDKWFRQISEKTWVHTNDLRLAMDYVKQAQRKRRWPKPKGSSVRVRQGKIILD